MDDNKIAPTQSKFDENYGEVEAAKESRGDIHDLDAAAAFLATHGGLDPLSPEEEKKMLRKIDWCLLPMLLITATLGATDKVALSTAAIYGLEDGLHLSGGEYSWTGSILFLGAISGMWPSSYMAQKLPTAKWICCCSVAWSSFSLLLPVARNFSGIMALRFFMGCAEAVIVPALTLIIAAFYKKSEQPHRNAIIFAAISSVVNGFLAWIVGHISEDAKLQTWQYLFLITGTLSMLWSIFAFIFMPATPMEAMFLSDREKVHAIRRLAENRTGVTNKEWKWSQALEAVIDPKTWILFLFNMAINVPNGGLTTFSSIIIKGLGFDNLQSSLLNMPTGVCSTISAFVFSWIAARWKDRRCLVTILSCLIPIIGAVLCFKLPQDNTGGQMVGLYFMYTYFGPYCIGISMGQANTAGQTKKNVQYAILYIGYAVGNLIGPQTFKQNQAPAYTGGFTAILVCYCACVALISIYWALAVFLNHRHAGNQSQVDETEEPSAEDETSDAFLDLTDFQRKNFRYTT